ncbi:hypothetical protein SAMN05444376_2471 [Bacteroides clarus YIT 12056]|nr:hypothetical protein SAMN05444376_2471 [Bacteroides clarus YIT 12056]
MKRGATLKQFKNAILGNFKLFNITAMLMQEKIIKKSVFFL